MKTLEQFKEEYPINDEKITKVDIIEQIYDAIDEAVKFAESWIDVNEELPEQSDEIFQNGNYKYTVHPVIVETSNGKFAISKRTEFLDQGWRWSGSGSFSDSVIKWRPINLP